MESDRSSKPLSPRTQAVLSLIQALLPPMTAILGGLWVVFTYIDGQRENHRKELETRRIETQRPFLEKQLTLYFEAAQVTGKLVVLTPDEKLWEDTERRFWMLYWSELSMVEDKGVERAMVTFSKHLQGYTSARKALQEQHQPINDTQMKQQIDGAALELAHAIRASIEARWSSGTRTADSAPP